MQDFFPTYGSNTTVPKQVQKKRNFSNNRISNHHYKKFKPKRNFVPSSRFVKKNANSIFPSSTQGILNPSNRVHPGNLGFKANSVNDKQVVQSKVYTKPFGSDRKTGLNTIQPFQTMGGFKPKYIDNQLRPRKYNGSRQNPSVQTANSGNTKRIYGRTYIMNPKQNIVRSNIYAESGEARSDKHPDFKRNEYNLNYKNTQQKPLSTNFPGSINSGGSEHNILLSNTTQNTNNNNNLQYLPNSTPAGFFPSPGSGNQNQKNMVRNNYNPPIIGNTTHFIQNNHFITINNPGTVATTPENLIPQGNQVYPLYSMNNQNPGFVSKQNARPKMIKSYSNQSLSKHKPVFKPLDPLNVYNLHNPGKKVQNLYAQRPNSIAKKQQFSKNIYTPQAYQKKYPKYSKKPGKALYSEQMHTKQKLKSQNYNKNPQKKIEKIPYPKSIRPPQKKKKKKNSILQRNINLLEQKTHNKIKKNPIKKPQNMPENKLSRKESLLMFLKRNDSKDLDLEKIDLGNKKKSPKVSMNNLGFEKRNQNSSPMRKRNRARSPLDAINENLQFFGKNKRRSATIQPKSKFFNRQGKF